jgi:hypothetical protein
MAPRILLVASVFVVAACAATQEGPLPPDARPTFADASAGGPSDAGGGSSADAPPGDSPDGGAPGVDGGGSGADAAAGTPDAPPATPDAAAGPPDAAPCVPTGELCNGLDDDCDGSVDENYTNLDKPCTAGLGECMELGVFVCNVEGTGIVCGAVPDRAGPIDLCDNNKDDDCDGEVDEGFPMLGKLCMVGEGACETFGVNVCNADLDDVVCDAVPVPPPGAELCGNDMDDDCDGLIDEGFTELGQECSVGVGECLARGIVICDRDDREQVKCGAIPGEPDDFETCNGKDDDCDGEVDNDDPGGGEACDTANPGVCGPGTTSCVQGTLACVPNEIPDSELCNGLDDDCDGIVDDRFHIGEPCDDDTPDFCKNGVFECANEDEAVCVGDTVRSESCNGLDDDCDGDVDENFDLLSNPDTCGGCNIVCGSNGVQTRRCTGGTCDPTCAFGRQSCDGNLVNGCEANRNTDPAWPTSDIPEDVSGDNNLANVTKTGYAEARYRVRVEEQDNGPDNQWVRLRLTNRDGVNMDLCAHCNGAVVCAESSGRTDEVFLFADETPWPLPGNDDTFTAFVEVVFRNAEREACNLGATPDWSLLIDSEADDPPGGAIVIDCD